MITIIAALHLEIRYLLEYFGIAQLQSIGPGTFYGNRMLHILQTGVGMKKAGDATDPYLKKYSPRCVINIGLAGSISEEITKGACLFIRSVRTGGNNEVLCLAEKPDFIKLPGEDLLTVQEPVMDRERRQMLFRAFGTPLVDMELFPIASIAKSAEIPLLAIKIVSDHADEATEAEFQQQSRHYARQLAGTIIPILEQHFL